MLIDSHCHLNMLDLSPFGDSLESVIQAAKEQGIEHMLCISVDAKTLPDVLKAAERFDCVSASIGIHPNDAHEDKPDLNTLCAWAEHPKVIGIGETGLDYYRSQGDLTWQRDAFITHIHAAKKMKKPLIIHTREARQDTIDILKAEQAYEAGAVIHCFTEDKTFAKQCLDEGFYISFSGIVTFKNALQIQEAAQYVPLDRMLIETDAPFLAPVPHRGKPNYPHYVKIVAEYIAQLRNDSFENIAQATTENFYRLFFKSS